MANVISFSVLAFFFSLNTYLSSLDCEASSHNFFKSLSSPLPGTNQYWCHMRNHGRDPCENPRMVLEIDLVPFKQTTKYKCN